MGIRLRNRVTYRLKDGLKQITLNGRNIVKGDILVGNRWDYFVPEFLVKVPPSVPIQSSGVVAKTTLKEKVAEVKKKIAPKKEKKKPKKSEGKTSIKEDKKSKKGKR